MQFSTQATHIDVTISRLDIAGWTGRNAHAVQHHIDELAVLGVAPPSTTPLFYQVSHTLLTQADTIQVLGHATSGEAEPLLISHDGALFIGLASDHTDRDLETTSVAASKQACAKVCAPQLWAFDDVADHVDDLQLRSWIMEDGDWRLYQDGTLAQILPLSGLATRLNGTNGAAMLCGTLPAMGGVRAASDFRAELIDPLRKKSIALRYTAHSLQIIS